MERPAASPLDGGRQAGQDYACCRSVTRCDRIICVSAGRRTLCRRPRRVLLKRALSRALITLLGVGLVMTGGVALPVVADAATLPSVTAVSPTSGSSTGGTSVTVSGTNFTGARTVRFGTTAGAGVTVLSATRLTVTAPSHAVGTVDVRVVTAAGTSPIVARDHFSF